MEIPEFLLEMSKQMNNEDNRMTSDPIWQVRCIRFIPTAEGCSSHHWELTDDDGVFYRDHTGDREEALQHLIENHHKWCRDWVIFHHLNEYKNLQDNNDFDSEAMEKYFHDYFSMDNDLDDLPSEIRKIEVQEVEDVVSTHLTEVDANWFIKRKQHDYPPLFTHTESAYWSPQIKELRAWILSLAVADA